MTGQPNASAEQRLSHHSPATVIWLTGLSGSGKTTLAKAVAERLEDRGLSVEVLDGDILRAITPTGFSREERDGHARRAAFRASRLAHHGITTVVALVSPYRASRAYARSLCERFVEVYVSTPLDVCERRDPKGLYARARAGRIKQFTGIDDPYEAPEAPDLELDTSDLTVDDAAGRILDVLFSGGSSTAAANALRVARSHLAANRYADAIAPLKQAALLTPHDPAMLHDLGVACLFAQRLPEAVGWLRRSIELEPTVARVHFELGLALAQAGNEDAALAALRTATALDPKLAEAHGQAGDILRRKNRLEDAAASYEQAFHASPASAYGLLCKGKALVAQDRGSEAEAVLKQAIACAPADGTTNAWRVEAELVLGHLLLEEGRFGEAEAAFERSIDLAPWQPTAHLGLVTSKKITEDDRPILERVLERLGGNDLTERQRMMLHFAAGKALDDLRDYGAAIEHFDAANGIRRKITPFDPSELARGVDKLIARFTRDFFAKNGALGKDDETPVLVLGMPRSGTTLIERILSSHPKVGGAGERSFWNENAPAWVSAPTEKLAARADALRASYLGLLRGVAPEALRVTDKMPFNFLWVGLVHVLLPKARFVHCRRNPLDTCLSIYSTYFAQHWGFTSDRRDLAAYYRQYARLTDHWRAVLPAGRMIDVDYEQATSSPEETARRLIAFCGLEWDPACLHPDRNADAVRTASRWQARQPIYRSSVERWRNYEPWLGELRELRPTGQ
jgi:adenylyl-sulfate kinase